MVLHVPFSPPVTGHLCGRVLRESVSRGKTAIVTWKFWLALAPVGDRPTGAASACRLALAGTFMVGPWGLTLMFVEPIQRMHWIWRGFT